MEKETRYCKTCKYSNIAGNLAWCFMRKNFMDIKSYCKDWKRMKLTQQNINHKAKKIALSLIELPIEDIDTKINQLTNDLICTMGIKKAKKTRLQIWRELKQIEQNLKIAHTIVRCVGRKLKAEEEKRR